MKRIIHYALPSLLVVSLTAFALIYFDNGQQEIETEGTVDSGTENVEVPAYMRSHQDDFSSSPGSYLNLEQVKENRKQLEERLRQYEESFSEFERMVSDL